MSSNACTSSSPIEVAVKWKNLSRFRGDTKRLLLAYRLHAWRENRAEQLGRPADSVLKLGVLRDIVQHIDSGETGIVENTRIPKELRGKRLQELLSMSTAPPTTAELEELSLLPEEAPKDSKRELMKLILMVVLNERAEECGIASTLLGGGEMVANLLRFGQAAESPLTTGWRTEVLGPHFATWAAYDGEIELQVGGHSIIIEQKG
ncbi:MAG: hypothetical protein EA384_00305 [Spirochaetaceae bacterium]|nr:MAG: hypothetical protein EA384_00305 [Spirochaetaceae bacterium]